MMKDKRGEEEEEEEEEDDDEFGGLGENMFAVDPLPYVIGTRAFQDDEFAGLLLVVVVVVVVILRFDLISLSIFYPLY